MFFRIPLPVFVAFLFLGSPVYAEIKIGIGTGLTGPHSSMGQQLLTGAEQAIEDINAKGGVLGEKLVSVPGDDRSDPKEAVSLAQKFISNDVKFIVGHLTSGASMATAKEYADAEVLMITPSATSPALTEQGHWNILRTVGRDDEQGIYAADYILKNFKNKKIAVVHDKASYGKPLADVVKKSLNGSGIAEVLYEGVNPGEKDYSALVSRLKNLGVDILYYGGYYSEAGLIIRQMREQGMAGTIVMGGDGLYNDELGQIAGDSVIGTLMTFVPAPQTAEAKRVVKTLRAKNIEPSGFTLTSYAAVQLLSQAATEAKSIEPRKIAETLRSGKAYETVLGLLSYNNKGDLTKAGYVMYEWKKDSNGKLVYTEIAAHESQ